MPGDQDDVPLKESAEGNKQSSSNEEQVSEQSSVESGDTSSTVQAVKLRQDRKFSEKGKQIRVGKLKTDISALITDRLYKYEQCFSEIPQNDFDALGEYQHALECDAAEVRAMYDELLLLCDNKEDEHIKSICAVFHEEIKVNLESIHAHIEHIEQQEAEATLRAEEDLRRQLQTIEEMRIRQAEARRAFQERASARAASLEPTPILADDQRSSNSIDRSLPGQNVTPVSIHNISTQLNGSSHSFSSPPVNQRQPTQTATTSTASSMMESSLENNRRANDIMVSPMTPNAGVTAMERLADSITQSMRATKRTIIEPSVYYGDPLKFKDWESDFDDFLEVEGVSTASRKIRMLKKFLNGDARECVEGYLLDETTESYNEARKLLKDRFGKKINISRLLKKKLKEWPRVPPKDGQALQRFADFLTHLDSAKQTISHLNSLDEPENNEEILEKLPDWLKTKWKYQIRKYEKEHEDYPPFSIFKDFICEESKAANILNNSTSVDNNSMPTSKKTYTPKRIQTAHTSVARDKKTRYCKKCDKDNHYTAQCNLLVKATYDEALQFLKENHLCFHCAQEDHRRKDCPRKWKCKICKREHPDCLHKTAKDWESFRNNTAAPSQSKEIPDTKHDQKTMSLQNKPSDKQQIVATARLNCKAELLNMLLPVTVSTNDGKQITIYAMLDNGSDTTYITEKAIRKLMLKPDGKPEMVTMLTLNGEETTYRECYKFTVRGNGPAADKRSYSVSAFEQRTIPYNDAHIPTDNAARSIRHLSHIAHLISPKMDMSVEMLIGRDNSHLLAPHESIIGEPSEPFAVKTVLGWTLCGGSPDIIAPQLRCLAAQNEFDDINDRRKISQNDIKFLQILEDGMKKDVDGSISLPLPFAERPYMPNNRTQALKRLEQLVNKFKKNAKMAEEYQNFMQSILDSGHAELVPEGNPTDGQVWYLPHFEVYHPRKKTLRVVFDASVKYNGRSLNHELLTGPDHMNSLAGILLRFRKEYVAISCDVQKMFHNFKVETKDRDYLRFVWVDPDLQTIRDYRMAVHLFGAASSPGVATFALRKLASEASSQHPAAASFITNDFYVDDGITSVAFPEEAKSLIKDSTEICKGANLRLHKFLSNDREVLDAIPKTEVAQNLQELDIHEENLPSERTLGLEWCTESDSFTFKNNFVDKPPTKRGILSSVSQIYDPLGLLAPVILQGRLLVQQSSHEEGEWDDTVSLALQTQWNKWKDQMKDLNKINIPRCLKPANFGEVKRTEIHYFGDASLNGYGACAYVRFINLENKVHVALLTAKSHVVPSKAKNIPKLGLTVPRLELQAAVEAIRLASFIRTELQMNINQEYFWSDSTATLGYIKNSDTQFHMFTANRVSEIRQNSDPEQWYHVPGSENPADIVSRGASINELATSNWYSGPSFLQELDINYMLQNDKDYKEEIKNSPEIRTPKISFLTQTFNSFSGQLITRFSSWERLVKAVANVQAMLRDKHFRKQTLTVQHLESAEKTIIRLEQQHHYSEELKQLNNREPIAKISKIKSLTPFLDQDNVIRMGSRSETHLSAIEKHPAIIAKSALAKLLITHYHSKVHHQGSSPTVAALRQAGFWIVGAASLTKSIIRYCTTCKKQRSKPMEQLMAPLPKERTEPSAPFTQVGIDAFGPFEVKDRRSVVKRWGLIFTCMYSRAVHIELLDDLSAESYLQALRRFESIRGTVSTIFCDGGTNFLGGRNQQEKDLLMMEDSKLKTYLLERKIIYKVNTPSASHQGGVWERQIRCIRSIFNSMFGKFSQRLTTEGLRTAFYEIMAAINNRPLSATSITDQDPIITANRLLTAKPSFTPPPPGDFDNEELYGQNMYRKVQQLAEEFWKMWKARYLTSIEQRTRWERPRKDLQVGDLVLVVDGNEHRNYWKTGRVIAVHRGADGKVRKASIMIGTPHLDKSGKPEKARTILERPIQKLVHIMSCD